MCPGKLFLYLEFQPWILWSGDSYLLALWTRLFPLCLSCIEKDVIDVYFPDERLFRTAINNFCFDRGHENVGKRYCHFCAHCGTVCLKKNFSPLKWKEFSFKISLSISLRWSVGIRGLFRWNVSYVLHTIVRIPSSCGMLVYKVYKVIWQFFCFIYFFALRISSSVSSFL